MSDQSIPRELSAPTEVAAYVGALATELATLARKTRLDTLEYLLELVRLEAATVNRRMPGKES